MKRIHRILLTFGILPLLIGVATGQVAINNQVDEWSDGAEVTLLGSGFGSKSPAAPLLWDPVDGVPAYSGLSDGSPIPVQDDGDCPDCPWPDRKYEHVVRLYDGPAQRIPGKPVYQVHKIGGFEGLQADLSQSSKKVMYVNWWVMSTRNLYDQGKGLVVNKLLRLWTTPDGLDGRSSWYIQNTMRKIADSDRDGNLDKTNAYYAGDEGFLKDNQWSNVEASSYSNGISGSGGGYLTLDVDNKRLMTTPQDLASTTGPYDFIQTIGSTPQDAARYDDDTYVYWGDIYVDTTRARVMVGNADRYSECTKREIQIPTYWTDDMLSFTANTGAFSPTDDLYLYVFNQDDVVNEVGYPVNSAPSIMPGQPSQPVLALDE